MNKSLDDLKNDLSTIKAARLRGEPRMLALKGLYAHLRELELRAAREITFMDFYEIGKMRKFIGEIQKALGV